MEFRLNKIEPDVREKVKETTKAGKVHDKTKHEFKVNSENKNDEHRSTYEFSKKKKKISVEAVKDNKIEIEVFHDGDGKTLGKFLDVKE